MLAKVEARVWAVDQRPKYLQRRKDPERRLWRFARPDGDNVLKSAIDALVMAGILADDKDVARWTVDSLYAAKGEGPCVEIELWSLREVP